MKTLTYALAGTTMFAAMQQAAAININFDYSLDDNGFFTDVSRRGLLEQAGTFFSTRLSDTLDAIVASGVNQYTTQFFHPATGDPTTLAGGDLAADTLLVYAGGQDLSGGTLGSGGPGGFGASGTAAFIDTVATRGEAGVDRTNPSNSTDFGPWGGSISFDTGASWYFDPDPTTTETFSGSDFYSVALHELGHLLGLGTAGSWDHWVSGGSFTGPASMAAHGGAVPLTADAGHWVEGIESTVDGVAQEAAMDPSLTNGRRKVFTELDMAALEDVGWEVAAVPLPPAVWLFGTALLGLVGLGRRSGRGQSS